MMLFLSVVEQSGHGCSDDDDHERDDWESEDQFHTTIIPPSSIPIVFLYRKRGIVMLRARNGEPEAFTFDHVLLACVQQFVEDIT